MLIDKYNRRLNYLRISITDFCNLRCIYCTPYAEITKKTHEDILRYEEIIRLVRIFVELGVNKIRLTGGEPLIKKNVDFLIREILKSKEVEDFSLTTNGTFLKERAEELRKAGLKRINISLDSLNEDKYRRITRNGDLRKVLEGIDECIRLGYDPIKINVVPLRGINEEEMESFIEFGISMKVHIRFIEFMPMGGNRKIWRDRFLRIKSIRKRLIDTFNLTLDKEGFRDGPAEYYRVKNKEVLIGFIDPISSHFCKSCNRIRITPDGKIRLCLESDEEVDIKSALRSKIDDEEIKERILEIVKRKPKRHNFNILKEEGRPMSKIGG
jgi:cyclic pyranopterin phosphate synthase